MNRACALVTRLLARAVDRLPPERREWGAALHAELAEVPAGPARLRWAAGGLLVAWRWRLRASGPRLVLLFVLCAALALVDRWPSADLANQASLLTLLIAAAIAGAVFWRRPWPAAIMVGSTLAVVHAAYLALDLPLPYSSSPRALTGALALLLLNLPALLAASSTARVRRRREPGVPTRG